MRAAVVQVEELGVVVRVVWRVAAVRAVQQGGLLIKLRLAV